MQINIYGLDHCKFYIIIAVDPPPPLQIPANPYLAFFNFNVVIKLWTILAPLTPIGWPIATAPPNTLTFYLGTDIISIITIGTRENASLNSK